MHLLVATSNPNKLREIRELLAGLPVTLHSLAELPRIDEPEETGDTFEANARLKAEYYAAHAEAHAATVFGVDARWMTVAEDSGLVIDGLDGEPGIRSARFLGEDATYPERFAEIERRLTARGGTTRTARFVCALAAVHAGRVAFETRGTVEGEIARDARGARGFGYDPIFIVPELGTTLADVSDADKARVGHRGHAFRGLAAWLRTSDPS